MVEIAFEGDDALGKISGGVVWVGCYEVEVGFMLGLDAQRVQGLKECF